MTRPGNIKTNSLLAALALATALGMASAAPAAGKAKLAGYAPANTNIYVEVDDFDKFVAAAKGSAIRKVFESDELRPVVEMLAPDKISVEGTELDAFVIFDLAEAKKFMTGGVAVFNSHRGPLIDIPGVEPFGDAPIEKTMHTDGVVVFEHDGKSEKEILEFFKKAVEKIDANAERERDKIGGTTVQTYNANRAIKVVEYEWNENAPEDAPMQERIKVTEREQIVPALYQFAVLEKVAYFGEGSNKPVSLAVAASQKKGAALDKAPDFKRFMDAVADSKDSKSQLLGFYNLTNQWDYADKMAEFAERPVADPLGRRDFTFAGVRVNLLDGGATGDAYLGAVDAPRGALAALSNHFAKVGPEAFEKVGADALTAGVVGLDLGGMLKAGIDLLARENPQFAMQKQFVASQVQAMAGIDIFEDFLFLLGDRHYLVEYAPTSDEWDPEKEMTRPRPLDGATYAIGLTDGARMAATVKTLVQKAGESFGAENFSTQRFEGTDLHLVSAEPGGEPLFALAATNGFLVLSESADHAKRAIASLGGAPDKSMARDKNFRRAFRDAPADACILQYASDIVLTPMDVSEMGGELLSFVAQYELMEREKLQPVFEKYRQQELNKRLLRLGVRPSIALWKGPNFLQLRADLVEIDPNAAKRSE
jgi:hypothetical protein